MGSNGSFDSWPINRVFWEAKQITKGKKTFEVLHVGRSEMIDFLHRNGFAKIFIGTNVEYIKATGAIIEKVQQVQIKDFVFDFIANELPEYLPHAEAFTCAELREKLLKGVNIYFSSSLLETLPTLEIKPFRDSKSESFFFFKNGIANVTDDNVSMISYDTDKGHVWRSQIMDREYTPIDFSEIPSEFDYIKFLSNVSGQDDTRLNSLISIVGYLLHTYKDPSRPYVVCLCDEMISDNPNGGTGKGLFIQSIKKMRNLVSIDGKGFKFDKSFLWQSIELSTQVVALEDVKDNFNFENMFSVITEGFQVEKKNKDSFHIPYEQSAKILITSNYTILGHGNSHERRKKEIEFAPYYNGDRTPIKEFGRMFFHDWSDKDWQYFDAFMLECVSIYLSDGIKDAPVVNLEYRKLKQETGEEFIDFIDNLAKEVWLDRAAERQNFQELYSDFDKLSQRKFNKWIDIYCEYLHIPLAKDRKGNSHLFKMGAKK